MIPSRDKIKKKLVDLIRVQGEVTPKIPYESIAHELHLTELDLRELTDDGKSKFEKEVRWARKDLEQEGVIENAKFSGLGTWKLISAQTIHPIM